VLGNTFLKIVSVSCIVRAIPAAEDINPKAHIRAFVDPIISQQTSIGYFTWTYTIPYADLSRPFALSVAIAKSKGLQKQSAA
jgi:hypothetical protein